MYDTNQSNQIWWELVRPEYRSLARKIFDQDWTWTTSLTEKGIEPRLIEEYINCFFSVRLWREIFRGRKDLIDCSFLLLQ